MSATRERIVRARENGTYEHLRPVLTDMIEVRQLSHGEAAIRLRLGLQTLRMAVYALGITAAPTLKSQLASDRKLIKSIRIYTAGWDRGW